MWSERDSISRSAGGVQGEGREEDPYVNERQEWGVSGASNEEKEKKQKKKNGGGKLRSISEIGRSKRASQGITYLEGEGGIKKRHTEKEGKWLAISKKERFKH